MLSVIPFTVNAGIVTIAEDGTELVYETDELGQNDTSRIFDSLFKNMSQLKHITIHRQRLWEFGSSWSPDQHFVDILKKNLPNIEEVIINDEGMIDIATGFDGLEAKYPNGIIPPEDYFKSWNQLTSLRSLNFGTFKACNGKDFSFLQLPQLQHLNIRGLISISPQDILNLLERLPKCQTLSIGGCRYRIEDWIDYNYEADPVFQDVYECTHREIVEPHYCEIMTPLNLEKIKMRVGHFKKLEKLRIEFAKNINIEIMVPLLRAFPNLTELTFQNCPGVSEELFDQLESFFPNLKIEIKEDLAVGVMWAVRRQYCFN